MTLRRVCLVGVLAAVLAPAGAQAQASLADAVERAWQRSAQSAEVAGLARRAEAERAAATSPWAAPPAVEVGFTRERQRPHGSTRESELGLAMPLWLPGQRAARLGQVEAEVALATANAAATRLRAAGTVRDAAAEVALQRAELAAAEAQGRELDALAQDVERRVAAGDLAPADALAANAERLSALSMLTRARQGLQAAQRRWQALTGLQEVPELQEPAVEVTTVAAHPALRAAALQREWAHQRLNVAKASRREAPELVLRARHESPSGEPSVRAVGIALRVPFGTAGRHDPLMAAALSELALAEATERELQQQIEADAATAREAERSARQQLVDETARAALLRERARLIEKSFRAGETALPDLLRAVTAAAQAEAAVQRAGTVLAQAASRLKQAMGVMP